MDSRLLRSLQEIVGPGNLATAPEELLCYAYDASGMNYPPAAVVFPGSTAEVSAIMRLATEARLPVIPRGAGSGVTGGALAVAGGLILVMSRFNRILEIDRENQVAVVEPGVITGQFQAAVSKLGLFYPPDPASRNFCTIGGNVAECAGGPSAVKYGVTRDYVLGLEVVLPDGAIMQTGVRTAKGVVGYDLTRLFVGSEGTLGVITKIIVRLLALRIKKNTFLVLAGSLARATGLVARLLTAGILPCTLEYMDRTALGVVAGLLPEPFPAGVEALLLIEVDGDEQSVAAQSDRLRQFLAEQPGILDIRQAATQAEIDALWAARRAISPATFQLKPHKISEDVVVPRTKIPDLVDFTEILARELGLTILTFGHAGDGNIHVNIMLNREDPQELARAEMAKKRLFEHVLQLAGTISGEHGIGLTKAAYLPLELQETNIRIMRGLKNLFDPHDIMNPGKIFPAVDPLA
ncbi:MAG: glycolate oxidase subunit GlcD [Deltaproteobacteria bacterium RIFOXYD12_FULL_57_12]|nr:MAG: glycolate oxidase subunit GlcD [Deltaproteobacteria bacterium RIFOXYD12_FULL_57_12]